MLVETLSESREEGDKGDPKPKKDVSQGQSLSKVEAKLRSSLISNTTYDVSLALPKGEVFFGHNTIKFNYKGSEDLFIDYSGTKIQNFVINGKKLGALDNTNYDQISRITIKKNDLKNGANVIEIDFLNKYRTDGTGLHSFTDNVDNQQYLYTQFEASECHKVFPSFD